MGSERKVLSKDLPDPWGSSAQSEGFCLQNIYLYIHIHTYIYTYITYIFGQYIELTKNSFEFLCDSIRKNTNELAGQLNK